MWFVVCIMGWALLSFVGGGLVCSFHTRKIQLQNVNEFCK